MEPSNADVCSVCLEIFDGCSKRILINEDLMELLSFLVVKIDASALQNTQICENCSEKILNASNFKLSFEKCRTLAHVKKEIDYETFCMCRICGAVIKKGSSAFLLDFMNNFESVMHYLTEELDLEILENPRICRPCQESVSNLQFIMNELFNYDKRKQHKNNTNILDDNEGQSFIRHTNLSENNQIKNIHIESGKMKNAYSTYEDFLCKNEKIDFKLEYKSNEHEEHSQLNFGTIAKNEGVWKKPEDSLPIVSANSAVTLRITKNDKKSSKIEVYGSEVCNFETELTMSVKRHMITHMSNDEVEVFKCDYCEFQTVHKNSLKKHKMKHESKRDIKCRLCEYKTYSQQFLKKHMIVHKDVAETTIFACKECDFKTIRKTSLRRHSLIHKTIDEVQSFSCYTCGYITKVKWDLAKHVLIHRETKNFKCDFCNFKTNNTTYLKKHKYLHIGLEVFRCNACTYFTVNKQSLIRHAIIHKKDVEVKLIKCKFCDYKAKRASGIRQHLLTHKEYNEVRTYKCDVCAYKTKRIDHLTGHMLVHKNIDEIQAFICDICGYKAKQKRYLKSHILNHRNKKTGKADARKNANKYKTIKTKKKST